MADRMFRGTISTKPLERDPEPLHLVAIVLTVSFNSRHF
jgi:hypothetical protein